MTPEMQLERTKLFTSVYVAMIHAYAGKLRDIEMHEYAQHEARLALISFDNTLKLGND